MRPVWSGSISFGLVSIPVKLYGASKERALKFHLLDKKDHCPISYKKVCRDDDKVIKQDDIVKGYEYEKGVYVVLDKEDFKRANAKKTETIDIKNFCDEKEIEAKYFDKPYYLEPEKRSAKAYALLAAALKESGKVGIATFVMREKEHIGVLKADGDVLEFIQLRFDDEIVPPDELNVPGSGEASKKEVEIALSLIEKLEAPFKISDYKDTYTAELMKVIEEKAKGKKIHVKAPSKQKPTEVTDLLAALRQSLEEEESSPRKK